ncbi:MAG: isochorismatase family protein [Anaerolineales bacterium]
MTINANPYSLIEADDSVLVVIDVQDAFLGKLPPKDGERLLNNICWLVKLAKWKQIPLVVTAEELSQQPLARKLVEALPAGTAVFDKVVFGLAHQPELLAAVEQTGHKTAVLIGLETDVCVMHSAIGLLEHGYRVVIVTDATGTPVPGQEIGLSRMQSAGAILVNMKGLFYEWLRTIEAVHRFHRELPNMRGQAGIEL